MVRKKSPKKSHCDSDEHGSSISYLTPAKMVHFSTYRKGQRFEEPCGEEHRKNSSKEASGGF
jgi:hypothetical protein